MPAKSLEDDPDFVIMGTLGIAHGVKGWLKVNSCTTPDTNILDYNPWYLKTAEGYETIDVLDKRIQGPHLVVHLKGCDNRETAKTWTNREVAIPRTALPDCRTDEFYWHDLEGLTVLDEKGAELGTLDHLIETGSKDIMVIIGDKVQQIPFIMHEVVKNVDLKAGNITVNWDLDE